ncbi:hypothetical protein GUITHDRAFT_105695 [Guillardia theta CCMP2712]|uniref:peptidylprolyl isomerase n=3 Tax=Guillardia theta TaxID=55529 RepID=L1JJQ0_GUITC|nr:hypothetical protein GUITHDRAFT_105695 [Guillardia theta CCMP2712]EKX48552.1 hypothetical protein GUITHDRAFT_105695 [Guillardia theta CCMP2712]|eukprot:XP_005835532.1 hypothetical protein GUITHDRAFT_105695 [Guillardia theta CCMP2712]
MAAGSLLTFLPQAASAVDFKPLENGEGVEYAVLQSGSGDKAKIGELVAIRFKASFNGNTFDDCFKTQNAYYYRVGSENIVKGLDLAVQNMRVGDRWALKVPPSLAFGDKGLKPSPGKPRIPGGATIEYEVLFETFPGREADILEVTGGEGV